MLLLYTPEQGGKVIKYKEESEYTLEDEFENFFHASNETTLIYYESTIMYQE